MSDNYNKILMHAIYLTVGTILIGMLIITIIITLNITVNNLYAVNEASLTFEEIYLHNFRFLLTLWFPVLGWMKYGLSMLYSFIVIGLSINQSGIVFVVRKLLHLPFELYSFCLVLMQSWNLFKDRSVPFIHSAKSMFLATILLGVSAYIESGL